jgi:uncharacterized RDD family membrane protein YckC
MARPDPETNPASLPRRLGALIYDALLLLGVLMLAVLALIFPYQLLTGQPYPHGEAAYLWLQRLYLVGVAGVFFVYFWTHGGQTLGMRAWRIRVIREDGGALAAGAAWRRFLWAIPSMLPAGLGLWWCLFDRDGRAWHDRLSRTRVVRSSE